MLRLIKSKKDAAHFLEVFEGCAKWDGSKHYIQLAGITLMKYPDGRYTFHRKNDLFEDIKEHELNSSFLYKYRKETNAFIKGIK
ncbi:hypothetical protein [Rossellomorea marisflavi]|uniref:hypothetical protein n=1 Tax=Rossellomorea marisflavi TaxID=189381 RepID=UPI00345D5129